jgi:hypothetical protein
MVGGVHHRFGWRRACVEKQKTKDKRQNNGFIIFYTFIKLSHLKALEQVKN